MRALGGVPAACGALALLVIVAGAMAAPAPPTGAATLPCFGAQPEAIVEGEQRPQNLFVEDGALIWVADGAVRRLAPGAKAATAMASGAAYVKAIDARQAFFTTGINDIDALDLATGRLDTIVVGHTHIIDALVFSTLAIDARYLYFGRDSGTYRRPEEAGLFRVVRDGSAAPEHLATEPDGHRPFIVADGFAYWVTHVDEQVAVVRRALRQDAPMQVVARIQRPGGGLLRVYDGRIYFVDGEVITSAPVDGRAAPTAHVSVGHVGIADLVIEGACLYWHNASGAIFRGRTDAGGGVAEPIGNSPRTSGVPQEPARTLASDGQYLFWADPLGGRIMRAGRGPAGATSAATVAARPLDAKRPDPMPPIGISRVLVGDTWGCARLYRAGSFYWECWDAEGRRGPGTSTDVQATLQAHAVPWMLGDRYVATSDRLCGLVDGTPRCWRWPDFARRRPRDAPDPSGAEDTVAGSAYAPVPITAGATLHCAKNQETSEWACAGADDYGPTGGGTPAMPGPALVADQLVLGTWHGCVADKSSFRCWGRNDLGQLGAVTTETCRVGGKDVTCSRAPIAPDVSIPAGSGIYPTSTFTCYQRGDVKCWGASRDGLFGTADACPAGLQDAFPTTRGPVKAPGATCSTSAAPATGFTPGDAPGSLHVGPRGMCGMPGYRTVLCNGAIPTPVLPESAHGLIAVSPGDHANACISIAAPYASQPKSGQVRCWGEGYTFAARGSPTLQILFDERPRGGAVVDLPVAPPPRPGPFVRAADQTGEWPKNCGIHYSCPRAASPLPACAPATAAQAIPLGKLLGSSATRAGATVAVSGPLRVRADTNTDDAHVDNGRCQSVEPLPIMLGTGATALYLDGLACAGDQSRRCCNAPAYGQQVIARGQLARVGATWMLRSPRLCAAPGPR